MATQITLPKDAEGREIPLDTKVLRTCHMEPDETASHAMCGPAVRCDACGAAVPAVGTLHYCPNCGAKVVQYGD